MSRTETQRTVHGVRRGVLLLVAALLVPELPAQSETPEVELQVRVLDSNRRSPSGGRFVVGQELLLEVRLLHLAGLHHQDRLQALEAERARRRGRPDPEPLPTVPPRPAPIRIGHAADWQQSVVLSPSLQGGVLDRPVGVPPEAFLSLVLSGTWQLDSRKLGLGRSEHRIDVLYDSPTHGGFVALSRTIAVEILREDQATAEESLAFHTCRARETLDRGRPDDSASHARRALGALGEDRPYERAVMLRFLGMAEERRGRTEDALRAYAEALDLVVRRLSGRTDLDELLERRIAALRRR